MTDSPSPDPSEELLRHQAQERAAATKRVVESQARLRVVVAGPGTGKTYCFRQALEQAGGGVALTFINNLANMMKKDLGGVAEVYTCHGFAKRLFYQLGSPGFSQEPEYYPPLFELFAEDLELMGTNWDGHSISLHFAHVTEPDGVIDNVLELGAHYSAVTHDDCVLRVTRYLRGHPEAVPDVPLLVVDEFQDFNRSEARFLWLLGSANAVLLAGDDDQALYSFKGASSKFLRLIHAREGAEQHCLPYCSRCPQVVTEAVNLVVSRAQAEGHLVDRLPKKFECYLPGKLQDSREHPSIRHLACTVENNRSPYVGRCIAEAICDIPEDDWESARAGGHPCVLVVGPMEFVRRASSTLQGEGVKAILKESSPPKVRLLDGYRLVIRDVTSCLGWRIVVHCVPPEGAGALIVAARMDDCSLYHVLPRDYVDAHLEAAEAVASALVGEPVAAEVCERIRDTAGQSLESLVADADDVPGDESSADVLCTSFAGSKGLSAHHVFIVGMNDGHFPRRRDDITDDEVCQLLVALSRTKKSCTLVSAGRFGGGCLRPSVFLEWLKPLIDPCRFTKDGLAPRAFR